MGFTAKSEKELAEMRVFVNQVLEIGDVVDKVYKLVFSGCADCEKK